MYINRRQTLLIFFFFSILYTLLCSWLKNLPWSHLEVIPQRLCLKGPRAAHLQHRVEVSGKERSHLTSLPGQVGPGNSRAIQTPSFSVSRLSVPPASRTTSTTASHHRSINLRSLRERKGDTCKSQRLTELPEARKRQPSNLTSQRSPPCWPRGPAYTAYSQDGRRTLLLGQNWCPPQNKPKSVPPADSPDVWIKEAPTIPGSRLSSPTVPVRIPQIKGLGTAVCQK